MAIYHFSIKAFSRSKGQSATAAAAYRSGTIVTDRRTGEVHDFTRKGRVDHAEIVMPSQAGSWQPDRSELWSAAELAEKRKDACVAREHEVALPVELTPGECVRLAQRYARLIAELHGCAVDIGIHDLNGRNPHAHLLCTTREANPDGLGEKCDREKAGRKRSKDLADHRKLWADVVNAALAEAGHTVRIDHRSLKDQGIDRAAQIHEGPAVTAARRRGDADGLERAEHNDAVRQLVVVETAIEAEQERQAALERQRAEQARQAAEQADLERQRIEQERQAAAAMDAELAERARQAALEAELVEQLYQAEALTPEPPRGCCDQWVEFEENGERYRHPEGRPYEIYWQNPSSGDWHLQPPEGQDDLDMEYDGYEYL